MDWGIRLHVQSSTQVASQNQRALRNLNEQYGQRSGELSHGLNMLDRVAHDLSEYVGILVTDKLEVEAQATVIFCLAASDAAGAIAKGRALTDFLAHIDYKLQLLVGRRRVAGGGSCADAEPSAGKPLPAHGELDRVVCLGCVDVAGRGEVAVVQQVRQTSAD